VRLEAGSEGDHVVPFLWKPFQEILGDVSESCNCNLVVRKEMRIEGVVE
jgi:hypothetical protein